MRAKFTFLLMCITLQFLFYSPQAWALQYKKAVGIVIGVLKWQDPGFRSFSKVNRLDKKLHKALLSKGVPKGQLALLLDKQATLKNITAAIKKQAQQASKNATFIFYYAGHGIKYRGTTYLSNYDIVQRQPQRNGLSIPLLAKILRKYFRGKRILFLADACYSGGLNEAAHTLAWSGFRSAVVTSATVRSISTGNWTYTQTLLAALKGNPFIDQDKNGQISLLELKKEICGAMKFRESQRCGVGLFGVSPQFTISKATRQKPLSSSYLKQWPIASYISAFSRGKWRRARIVQHKGKQVVAQFFTYSGSYQKTLAASSIRKIRYKRYKVGQRLIVQWLGKIYPAKVLQVQGDFHLISYPGWSSFWDEWIMSNRILRTGWPKPSQRIRYIYKRRSR